jgi:pyruvate/2-oxoglutarate dehydrogenase complex dihydrolipoamide dehydrogenase (E3) component
MSIKYDYDVIIIGAGASGLVASVHSRGMGKKVLLIDKSSGKNSSKIINDIQLKSFNKYAEDVEKSRILSPLGITTPQKITTDALLATIREKAEMLSKFSSFTELNKLGIDTHSGKARIQSEHSVKSGTKEYSARKIIIAAGTQPMIPAIPGIESSLVITPSKLFSLTTIPKSICIIGGGTAGLQFASSLSVFGTKVVVLETEEKILRREDNEVVEIAEKIITSRGVQLITNASVEKIEEQNDKCNVHFIQDGKKRKLTVENVLLTTGRIPALDKLGLDESGIAYNNRGISVNKFLQTSVPSIYACGDITGPYYTTNRAETQGTIAAINALTNRNQAIKYSEPFWSLSLIPDLSRFGLTEKEALARYSTFSIRTFKIPYKYSMNSVVRDSSEGFAKIICKNNGTIIGAHIIGENSAELVTRLHQAQQNGTNFSNLSFLDAIFPSYSDVLAKPSLKSYVEQQSNSLVRGIFQAIIPHKKN